MAPNIEAQINALRGYPIGTEITEDPTQYKLWILANFQQDIPVQRFLQNRECCSHLERLAELENTDYGSVFDEIQDSYMHLLNTRSERLGDEIQQVFTEKFIGYASSSREYLEKLNEALDDHLGLLPERIDSDDVGAMAGIYESLRKAHTYSAAYGYGLHPKSQPNQE